MNSKCELCLKSGSEGGFEMLLVANVDEVAEMTLNTISLGRSRTLCAKCCQDLILVGGLLFKWSQNVCLSVFTSEDGVQADPRWRDVKNEVFTEMDLAENDGEFGRGDVTDISDGQNSNCAFVEACHMDRNPRGVIDPLGDKIKFSEDADKTLDDADETVDGELLKDRFSWMLISDSDSWTCKSCSAQGFEKTFKITNSLKGIIRTLKEHELSREHASASRTQKVTRTIEGSRGEDDERYGEMSRENESSGSDFEEELKRNEKKTKDNKRKKDRWKKSDKPRKVKPKRSSGLKANVEGRIEITDEAMEAEEDGARLKRRKGENRATNHAATIPAGAKNQWHFCPLCGKYLVNDEELQAHSQSHKDGENLTCDICSESFANIVSLQEHRRTHEKKRKKTNAIVVGEIGDEDGEGVGEEEESFKRSILVGDGDEDDLIIQTLTKKKSKRKTNHAARLVVNGNKKNQWKICPVCGKFVVDEEELTNHMGLHVEMNEANKTEKCSTCGEKFTTTIQLHEHSKIHRQEDPRVAKFVEALGGEGAEEGVEQEKDEDEVDWGDGEEELGDEEEEEEDDDNEKNEDEAKKKKKRGTNHAVKIVKETSARNQWTICSVCGKYLVSEKALSRHMETHNETREMTCEFCHKKFQTRKTLYSHRKIHFIGDKFKCDICDKNFSSKPNLSDHKKKIHGGGQRDKLCRFCSKEFWSATILREHERIHTNEKPYECKLCGRPFRTAGLLRKHVMRTHHNEKRYPCRICGRPFSATGNRKEHERNVHGIDKIYCPRACGKSFRRNRQMKDHALLCTGIPSNVVDDDESFVSASNNL